ncbi:MAG TPA: UrcA family protein [Pseudomonadales bacterium]
MHKFAFAVAALTLSGAAAADTSFRWSPDDLATLDGIAVTHGRIESAARDFCRSYTAGTPGLRAWRSCVDAVTEEIVMSIDDQRLTAYAATGKVDEALLAALPGSKDQS